MTIGPGAGTSAAHDGPASAGARADKLYPARANRHGMRAGVAALVIAVVVAGCSGIPWVGDRGGGDPVVTPAPGDQASPSAPPGVLSLQVVNPGELGRAHAGAIENRSYALTSNRTVRHANGTVRSRLAVDVSLDGDRAFRAAVSTAGPDAPVLLGEPPAEAVYWSDGTTYLRRLTRDGETTYTEFDPPSTWVGTWSYWAKTVPFGGRANRPATFYSSLFSAVPASVNGRTTLANTTHFRIVNDRDRPFTDRTFPGRVSSVRDLSLVALVDGDGLVRSLELRYSGTIDGEPVRVRHAVRYTDVGTTSVDRPSWYDRATSDAPASG